MTRSEARGQALRDQGAEPVVCDAFDADAVERAVIEARPEVVIHQLTDIPKAISPWSAGAGCPFLIHVDDAAAAAVAALDSGSPGIYNVVDDDPAPVHDWLPEYAAALGAPAPRKVPKFVARLAAGKLAVNMMTGLQGSDNGKAKRELGWQPCWTSWRQGFSEGQA